MYQGKVLKYKKLWQECKDIRVLLEDLQKYKRDLNLYSKSIRLFKNIISYANTINHSKPNVKFTTFIDTQSVNLYLNKVYIQRQREIDLYNHTLLLVNSHKKILKDNHGINSIKLNDNTIRKHLSVFKRKENNYKIAYELYKKIANTQRSVELYKREIKSYTRQMNNSITDSGVKSHHASLIRSQEYYNTELSTLGLLKSQLKTHLNKTKIKR